MKEYVEYQYHEMPALFWPVRSVEKRLDPCRRDNLSTPQISPYPPSIRIRCQMHRGLKTHFAMNRAAKYAQKQNSQHSNIQCRKCGTALHSKKYTAFMLPEINLSLARAQCLAGRLRQPSPPCPSHNIWVISLTEPQALIAIRQLVRTTLESSDWHQRP